MSSSASPTTSATDAASRGGRGAVSSFIERHFRHFNAATVVEGR